MPQILQTYKPVTDARLKQPDDGDWLSVRRTYDGWGYSPLAQINAQNVQQLQPVWVFWHEQRARGHSDGEQRRDVRVHAGQSSAGD
jgi:glucose dehydrogenase